MLLVVEDKSRSWLQSLIWMCISTGLVSFAAAYSHGGSLAACSDMRPKHIRAQPQNPRKNYITIHTNRSFYLPGDRVPVTVRSTRDFMGFFLQARRVLNDQVAGSFVFIPPGSKLLRCFEDGDTVTHSDKSLKRNLSFVWKSPDQPVGDIKFFVSVVQSYFVYWARIESAIVSGHMLRTTSEISEISDMETTSVLESRSSSSLPYTGVPFLISSSKTKPPETLLYTLSEKGKYTPSDVLSSSTASTSVVVSTKKVPASRMDSSFKFPVSTAPQTLSSQKRTLNHSTDSRNQDDLQGPSPTLCPSCQHKREMVSSYIRLSSPTSSLPPDLLSVFPISPSPTQDIQADPTEFTLQESQSQFLPPLTTGEERHKPTNEVAANFLQQPESASSVKNIEVEESTSPLVTKTVHEIGKGGEKGRGMHLAMTQLGILLGCSVVLGMSLAAGLRCIHAQYCHKRTEVSFSEPDDNVITLRESGEMMHFKKIRENSFVLVQAEYNWITPALSTKTQ
ncbi:reelin domain-containing protein 1 [Aquarana catesbeiana]|uniref:reelin domain-containing protein 1 n=1 Tax=Aquarana catesbeiana TaxID=8400 RepID=UPI003CC9E271